MVPSTSKLVARLYKFAGLLIFCLMAELLPRPVCCIQGFRDGSIHTDAPHPVQVNLISLLEGSSVQTDACCTRSREVVLHFADPV
jgi:hypothetical protein